MPSSTPSHWIARACQWLMGVDAVSARPAHETEALDLFAGCEVEVPVGLQTTAQRGAASAPLPARQDP